MARGIDDFYVGLRLRMDFFYSEHERIGHFRASAIFEQVVVRVDEVTDTMKIYPVQVKVSPIFRNLSDTERLVVFTMELDLLQNSKSSEQRKLWNKSPHNRSIPHRLRNRAADPRYRSLDHLGGCCSCARQTPAARRFLLRAVIKGIMVGEELGM